MTDTKPATPATDDVITAIRMCLPAKASLNSPAHQVMTLIARIDAERAQVKALEEALGFAASVIKSGEDWTDTCERVIGGALKAREAGNS